MADAIAEKAQEASLLRVRTVAAACVERAEALGLKGKRRDAFALDYFLGAGAGLRAQSRCEEATGTEAGLAFAKVLYGAAAHLETVAGLIITVRGFAYVAQLAKGEPI